MLTTGFYCNSIRHQFALAIIALHIGDLILGIHIECHHRHTIGRTILSPGHVIIRGLGLHQNIGALLGDVGLSRSDCASRSIILSQTQHTVGVRNAVIGFHCLSARLLIVDGGVSQSELCTGKLRFVFFTVHLGQLEGLGRTGYRSILDGSRMIFSCL